ncbi:MAG: DNA polymerase III subunit gamma/tau [Bdellovibrionales bacterium]|nr:DNA polymerase III subunit gamma/tau [Bdellovibrionales bacterium]
MAYQVIARKFRPRSFDEFVGQAHVKQTLLNAMSSDRFPHAILFTGPRGTGKTTTARIVAKTLLCENPQNNNPCNKCQSCLDVAEGRHLDVIEIDGASNNGVDQIRELRETVGYMPSSGKYKVYIIDEVHMLSTSAFNALLKTLEEPPEHVIFMFATTEVQKIPATILSRCQRFDFRNHTLNDIADHLKNICKQEGINSEDAALFLIAKQAKGSIRDSLTLLEQIISFSGKNITLQAVMDILGLTDRHLLLSTIKAIANKDKSQMFEATESFKSSGYDPTLFAEELLELWRNALMVKMDCHKQGPMDIGDNEIEELQTIVSNMGEEDIHLLFDVTLSGLQRLGYSHDPMLALEMLLFKLLSMPRLQQGLPIATAPVAKPTAARATTVPQKKTATRPPTQKVDDNIASAPIPVPNEPVEKTWVQFVHLVKEANGFLGALLEHTFIHKEDDKVVQLGLPEKMSFLLDKLQEAKNIERTQTFLKNFWNDSRTIEIEVISTKQLGDNLSPKAQEEQARKTKHQKEAETIEAHPLVKAAEEAFGDQLTRVKVTNPTNMENH